MVQAHQDIGIHKIPGNAAGLEVAPLDGNLPRVPAADTVGNHHRGSQNVGIEAMPGGHQRVRDSFVTLTDVKGVGIRQKRPGPGFVEQGHNGADLDRGNIARGAGFPEVHLDGHQGFALDLREHPGAFDQPFDPFGIGHFHRGPQVPEVNLGRHAQLLC